MDHSARGVPAAPFARVYPWAVTVLIVSLAVAAADLVWFKLHRQPPLIDFLTMWAGGGIANTDVAGLYDFPRVDRAQAWLLGAQAHDRPFPYPPSALLVFAPLARLPFWLGGAVWSAGGMAAFLLACRRLAPDRRRVTLAAILVLPGVVWAGLSGQCAFAVGAMAIGAVILLDRRPALAGLLLGLALALKPTLLLMAPVALLSEGRWRALIVTGAAGAAAVGLSAMAFGAQPWIDWLTVAPHYLAKISEDPRYVTGIIAPSVLAGRFGLTGSAAILWRVACIAAGAALAGLGFRGAKGSSAPRLAAMVVGSLIASPYAMNYETALLAPVAAIALATASDNRSRAFALVSYAALALAGLPDVGVYAFIVFVVLLYIRLGPWFHWKSPASVDNRVRSAEP